MSGVNCPECYMRDGAHKMDCSVGRTHMSGDHNKYYKRNLKDEIEEGLDALPLITVTEIKENEDGSATAVIDTSVEGTRFLVEMGLISLLEKAIDEENTEYTLKNGLHE